MRLFFSAVVIFTQIDALSGEEVNFQLKFEPDKTYLNDVQMSQSMMMPMAGRELETKMMMSSVVSQKVTKTEEGIQVVQATDTVNIDMNAAGMNIKFDSENPEGPMAAIFKPMMDAKTAVVLSKEGEVLSAKAETFPGMENFGLSAEVMEKGATEIMSLMPNKVIPLGESWKVTSSLPLPGMTEKPTPLTYTLTFAEMTDFEGHKVAKINIEGVAGGEDKNLKVTSKELSGVMFFDPEIGQPRELKMKIGLEISVPGAAQEGDKAKMAPIETETVTRLKEIK